MRGDGASEVVVASGDARGALRPIVAACFGVQLVFLGIRATDGEPWRAALLVVAVVLVAALVCVDLADCRAWLVVRDDELEVRRRFRAPQIVARADVVAVEGDVAGRPTWSEHVVVRTDDRTLDLPRFHRRPPADLVPQLQEWVDTGRRPPPG
ncbi:hypothetical protein [Sanguibacter suaedae]|uniref:PH domain-containing protein n=1 Tax=Sanguibacter suaedae TaxID=2795737 RepID=A0A934M8M3_9MICO|nr:hypothetical protein [Sanguibacter suaedae]MBI9113710.1 hypothetical protein [Sanguibacter suaedae]